MSKHRGMTLLEILLATAMLALLAATCAPLLRNASAAIDGPSFESHHVELQRVADEFIKDPGCFGIEDVHAIDSFDITESETLPSSVHVQRLNDESDEPKAIWLCFSYQDSFVLKRVRLDPRRGRTQ